MISTKMNFVYYILAHHKPQQFQKLVAALLTDHVHILIHVDQKSDIREFMDVVSPTDRVIYCNHRNVVTWGGYGQIEAILRLMHLMYECHIPADYVHIMSGQDYVLRPNPEIFDFFERNRGKNFLDAFPLPSPRWSHQGMDRINYFWYIEDMGFEKAAQYVHTQEIMKIKRPYLPNTRPYGGSAFWSLTGDCIQWLYQTCKEGDPWLDYYKYTLFPEEMLFQTMLMNSENWKESVVLDNDLRAINWDDGPEYPRIWRNEDFDRLIGSGKLFARKFDEQVDHVIIERLEKKNH